MRIHYVSDKRKNFNLYTLWYNIYYVVANFFILKNAKIYLEFMINLSESIMDAQTNNCQEY